MVPNRKPNITVYHHNSPTAEFLHLFLGQLNYDSTLLHISFTRRNDPIQGLPEKTPEIMVWGISPRDTRLLSMITSLQEKKSMKEVRHIVTTTSPKTLKDSGLNAIILEEPFAPEDFERTIRESIRKITEERECTMRGERRL